MSRLAVSRALVVASLAFTLTGCQVLDDLVGGTPEASVEESATDATETASSDESAEATTPNEQTDASTQAAVPNCDTLYSDALEVAFGEEGRISEGDISADGYGYGTTNQDLIAILEGVRTDLRVSCTWYLPPEFSSTTSMAILATEAMAEVQALLGEAADTQTALGGGELWKLESTSSNISGEFIANEAHFIANIPCPSSLAETDCSIWVASTNSAGSSEELTRDAARTFGVLN